MAESPIQITQGSGTNIDVVQPGGGSTNRQVIAVGDPNATLAAAIANVSNGQLSVGATLYGGINVSLAGTNVSLQGTANVAFASGATVTAQQGTSPWLTNASIVGTPGVNASIAGTVPISGNIGLVANTTITAYQGTSPWLSNASIVGTPNVAITGEPTVLASITGQVPVTASISGTVPVSGTFWQAEQPVTASIIGQQFVTASIAGQVPVTASIAGTVLVSGNVSVGSIQVSTNSSITAFQGGAPWLENVSIQGIPAVSQSGNWNVLASLANDATLTAFQGGNWSVTLAGNVSIGSLSVSSNSSITAFQGGSPWLVNASLANNATITAFQGTSPWVTQDNFSQTNPVTASWVTATAQNTALAATCTDYSSAVVTFVGTGSSFATGAITFESFDGANWFPIQAARTNSYTVDGTYTLGIASQSWEVDVGGWQQIRVRLSTAITGTGTPTALVTIILQGAAADPSVIVGQSTASQLQTTANLATGSTLTAYQGTSPWLVNASIVGQQAVTVSLAGSATLTAFQGGNWTATLAGNVSIGSPNINNIGPGANIGNVVISLGANATLGMPVQIGTNSTLTAFQGASPWLVNASIIGAHNVSIAGNVTLGPANVSLTGGVVLWPSPTLTGWTPYASAGLASIATISGVAGKFGGYMITNLNSAPAYLQLFDVATGTAVSLGLSYNQLFAIPANGTAANGLAANLEITNGVKLSNGLKAAVTTGVNSTMVATGLVGTLWYV